MLVEMYGLRIALAKGQISAFNTVFVHIRYASNMAACYDLTAPYVFHNQPSK